MYYITGLCMRICCGLAFQMSGLVASKQVSRGFKSLLDHHQQVRVVLVAKDIFEAL